MKRANRRYSFIPLLIAVAPYLVLAGCADTPPSTWAGSIMQLENGSLLIANPAEGLWNSEHRWRLADTIWIGELGGGGPEEFGQIAGLEVDEHGRILIFDGQARQLRIFDRTGSFLSSFGRRGAGPGEFESVVGMSENQDRALWLVDAPNVRYTALKAGEVNTYRRVSPLYRLPWAGGHSDGYFYDTVVLPEDGNRREALIRVDSAGVAVDTFFVPEAALSVPRRGSMTFPLPYAPENLRAFDQRGFIWVGQTHEYRLHQVSLTGDTVRTVTRSVAPPPLSSAQQDSIQIHARALTTEFGVSVTDEMIPRNAPLIGRITVADDGSIWVTRAGAPDQTELDIFDPDGRFLGSIRVGFPLGQLLVRQGWLYATTEDELGVPKVIAARIST